MLAFAACAHRPIAIKSGTSWTVPLDHPLDQHSLVVQMTVDGKGPYPFLLDPLTPDSTIDRGVAEQIGLYSKNTYTRILGQDDHTQPARIFEVITLDTGDLHAGPIKMTGVRPGSLSADGQPIAGIVGGDVLTNSLVIDVDRDSGVLRVAVAGHEHVPAGAERIRGRDYWRNLLVPVRIDREHLWLAVKPSTSTTALWQAKLEQLPPARTPEKERVVDETGTVDTVDVAHVADALEVDGTTVPDVPVARYDDRRAREVDYDGVLGEDVLARYHVLLDLHHSNVWLAPRDADLATHRTDRLMRWGDVFAKCAADGCATITTAGRSAEVTASSAAKAASYQVVLEALDINGKPTGKLVVVAIGAHATAVPLEGASTYRVVDATP
jgi:hypothetical protein